MTLRITGAELLDSLRALPDGAFSESLDNLVELDDDAMPSPWWFSPAFDMRVARARRRHLRRRCWRRP